MTVSDLVTITTTFAMREQAIEMAKRAIDERLVACAQIDGPIESLYVWEGKACQDTEWRLTMKTTATAVEKLRSLVHGHHPYQQPQWIVLPVLATSEGYGAWVRSTVVDRSAERNL